MSVSTKKRNFAAGFCDQENYHDVARLANSQADLAKIIRMSDYLRHHPGQKTVPDPYYGDTRDFEFALELLEDACEGLLDELVKSTSRK